MKLEILLVPVGNVPTEVPRWLSEDLPAVFDCTCTVETPLLLPELAWNARRQQYDAERVLGQVKANENALLLAIADADLYVRGLNFVFGLAQARERRAIIALPRLRRSFYGGEEDFTLFRTRLLKEAVHEMGHVLGLGHCNDRRCVMAFSNRLADTDYKTERFCKQCDTELRGRHRVR